MSQTLILVMFLVFSESLSMSYYIVLNNRKWIEWSSSNLFAYLSRNIKSMYRKLNKFEHECVCFHHIDVGTPRGMLNNLYYWYKNRDVSWLCTVMHQAFLLLHTSWLFRWHRDYFALTIVIFLHDSFWFYFVSVLYLNTYDIMT